MSPAIWASMARATHRASTGRCRDVTGSQFFQSAPGARGQGYRSGEVDGARRGVRGQRPPAAGQRPAHHLAARRGGRRAGLTWWAQPGVLYLGFLTFGGFLTLGGPLTLGGRAPTWALALSTHRAARSASSRQAAGRLR